MKITSILTVLIVCCPLVIVSGCNNSPDANKTATTGAGAAPQNPPAAGAPARDPRMIELASGRIVFDKLLASAHLWALDAKPVTLQSQMRKENSKDGRSCVWGLIVASESKKQTKIFDWSGIMAADAHTPGVHESPESDFNPKNPNTHPFDPVLFTVDSSDALKTANAKAGKDVLTDGIQQSFRLKLDNEKKHLVWTVSYGTAGNAITHTEAVEATKNVSLPAEKK